MCGVCGFAGQGSEADLAAMTAVLARRGPDGEGRRVWPGERVFFGHRRLSIIDLEGGAQPMETADGRLAVVFNGEIYNHLELRSRLEGLGHRFLTDHSDTEVLLHGYRQWGRDLAERLNGMWAFAILDRDANRLFLSRDRFGKKPLFYSLQNGTFAFASELTSLAAHAGLEKRVCRASLRKYFAYGFIPAPNSLYERVFKLPGGFNLTVDLADFSLRTAPYWAFCVDPDPEIPERPEQTWAERIRETLDRAVARRLMADVPLGVFLSGGLDSSSVAALAARHAPGVQTFSIAFNDARFDESRYARLMAARLGTRHHETMLTVENLRQVLPLAAEGLDEPMGDSSLIPTYLLCREARKHVVVALGGDGADELFAGYDPFKALRAAELYEKICPRPLHRALRLAAERLPASHGYMAASFKIKRFLRGLGRDRRLTNPVWLGPLAPEELSDLFREPCDPEEVYAEAIAVYDACPSVSLVDKTLEFYTRLYLQDQILVKTDRAGMLNSLEVRAPYLDLEMAELAASIPNAWKFRRGVTKYILKKALEPLLPREIRHRRKQGFAMPVGRWLAEGTLAPGPARPFEGFDERFVAARLAAHRQGRSDERLFLWNLWLLRRMPLA